MANDLIPINDIKIIADVLVKSRLFGIKTIEEAMALCFIAQSEGKHPATAAMEYHIIQGRPALKADAMLARFQQSSGKVKWLKLSDTVVSAEFSHLSGGTATIDWDMPRAEQAQLFKTDKGFRLQCTKEGWKAGSWQKYPRQMLRARVISEGIRTVFPGVIVGAYTPEEVQDFEGATIDVQPTYPVPDLSIHSPDGMTQDQKKALYAEAEEVLDVVSDIGELSSWRDQYDKKLRTNISAARMKILDDKTFAIQQVLEAKERAQ